MKKLMSICVFLIFTGCFYWSENHKLVDNYRGYIYDFNNEPLEKVRIYEMYLDSAKYAYTDKNGYFLLKRGDLNFVDDLIIEKEGYISDTIYSYSENANRMGNKTRFLMEWSDTVYMEKIKKIALPKNENN